MSSMCFWNVPKRAPSVEAMAMDIDRLWSERRAAEDAHAALKGRCLPEPMSLVLDETPGRFTTRSEAEVTVSSKARAAENVLVRNGERSQGGNTRLEAR